MQKMTEEEFAGWVQRLGYPEETVEVIRKIRTSDPSKPVDAPKNTPVHYSSPGMGHTMHLASQWEYGAVLHTEFMDKNRIEHWEQPPGITLNYKSLSGRRVVHVYTPDFFFLDEDRAGWEEWKREEELADLAKASPHRYVKQNGAWRCPPGEAYARPFGLEFRLRSYAELNPVVLQNLEFIKYYLCEKTGEVPKKDADKVIALIRERQGIDLRKLLGREYPFVGDVIYRLLVKKQIYIDLERHLLAEPQLTPVFTDEITAEGHAIRASQLSDPPVRPTAVPIKPGAKVLWDGVVWTIKNDGGSEIYLENGTDPISIKRATFIGLIGIGRITPPGGLSREDKAAIAMEIMNRASVANMKQALRWFDIIKSGRIPRGTVERTLYYKKQRMRLFQTYLGDPFLGLINFNWERGNSGRKLPKETIKAMGEFIEKWLKPHGPNRWSIYKKLRKDCKKKNLLIPSYVTFCTEIRRQVPEYVKTKFRKGHRTAYAFKIQYWQLELTTPRHGDRTWQIVHVDHTVLDLEAVDAKTYANLGRPRVTFVMDAYSRKLLVVYVSFEAPSYRTCMMVMRLLVRKYNRLPEFFVVDRGPEFRSTYFEVVCSHFGVNKKTRPVDDPRAGTLIENLFGVANREWTENQLGNTKIMKNVREVTRETEPKALAKYNILEIQKGLEEWAADYNARIHRTLGMSPDDAYNTGLLLGGERPETAITYDEDFINWILPTTPKSTAKVFPGVGLKVNNIPYYDTALRQPDVEGKTVAVRYDPWDIGYIKAFVKDKWIVCLSKYYSILKGRSEADLKRVSEEVRQKYRVSRVSTWQIARVFQDEDKDLEKSLYKGKSDETNLVNNYLTGQQTTETTETAPPQETGPKSRDDKAPSPEHQPERTGATPEAREYPFSESDETYGRYKTGA